MKKNIKSKAEPILFAGMNGVLGPIFAAATEQGIFRLELTPQAQGIRGLRRDYPRSPMLESSLLKQKLKRLDECLRAKKSLPKWKIALDGTPFQRKVWKALQRIPKGETRSYLDIARAVGRPRATRAVGSAVARNPIGILVPCHRVIRNNGDLGGFAWGLRLKRKLLDTEQK